MLQPRSSKPPGQRLYCGEKRKGVLQNASAKFEQGEEVLADSIRSDVGHYNHDQLVRICRHILQLISCSLFVWIPACMAFVSGYRASAVAFQNSSGISMSPHMFETMEAIKT